MTTPLGQSDTRSTRIERCVLRLLQQQGSATVSYLWNHAEPPATHNELIAAASALAERGLAEQSLAGRHPIENCWDITAAGRAEP